MDKINDRRQWIVDEFNCFNTTPSWIGSKKNKEAQCLHVINTGNPNTTNTMKATLLADKNKHK